MSEDEEEDELEWDECCVCGKHWTGLLSVGPQASFYRCSKCGEECCEECWDEELKMCSECAEETREEKEE